MCIRDRYTAYTPYQPEISQGRLEALINFQTVIGDLAGLPTANASLLDEGTAVAEAMTLVRRANRKATGAFVVDSDALPQTIEVVRTRAEAMGIEVAVADLAEGLPEGELCGVLVQYPGASGRVLDPRPVIEAAHERNALVVVAAARPGTRRVRVSKNRSCSTTTPASRSAASRTAAYRWVRCAIARRPSGPW